MNAARMRWFVAQRQTIPDMTASTSASLGFGLVIKRAAAGII